MKRKIGVLAVFTLLAIGFGIPWMTVPSRAAAANLLNVCVCPYEQWGEDPEEPYNEYWLCMDCDQLFFVSETLPDNTVGVDCGNAFPDDCVGCLSVPAFAALKAPNEPAAKLATAGIKETGKKLKPVLGIRKKKAADAELKKVGVGFEMLSTSTVQFRGETRDIMARLFLLRIPAKGKRPEQIVAHGWEIEDVTPDFKPKQIYHDGFRYYVTLGDVTYPVLTVQPQPRENLID